METLNLKTEYRQLYAPRAEPLLLTVPELPFLMIDGKGDPDGPEYAAAVSALYSVAYGIRGLLKSAGTVLYSVPPLQGQWDGGPSADRSDWTWTVMMTISGRHHEIYLSNPDRAAPHAMKTLIRYPVTALPH